MNGLFRLGKISDKTLGADGTWLELVGGSCTSIDSANLYTDPDPDTHVPERC
jgi:hypothetical protein